ncbi:FIST N-terminal domain-containing protein [Aurantimonas sp. Leaf443]|uniref:FIST N-terminal domain-containing protein n=1 Tax=Aurantimonas sp. Leaf443 TaxID=1736378 RepID=UPI000A936C5A|nr:FIST N-terminal domain-containing protein [Aurantimonas sp. Leaf443]
MTAKGATDLSRGQYGVRTAMYHGGDAAELAACAAALAEGGEHALLLVFFDPGFDAADLGTRLKLQLDVPWQICCSTAGGLSPLGYVEGGAAILLFEAEAFAAMGAVVPHVADGALEAGAEIARELRARFDRETAGRSAHGGGPLALCLVDGLSNQEETVVAAFDAVLSDIPLVGGSAGDRSAFRAASLVLDGRVHRNAAILCLLWSDLPFRIFKSDHFEPTRTRLVVTGCDPDRRLVTGLNGAPAAEEYATVLGLDPLGLDRFSFAAYPVVVRIGGEHYCRSIRSVEAEGLTFFCAVEEGIVLTLARSRDMVGALRETLSAVSRDLGGIALVLGFDCILRRVEAEQRQLGRRLAEVFDEFNVIGFTSYGEQYRAMHLNQTFTGVAFGRPGAALREAAE